VSPDDNDSRPGLALIIIGEKFAKGVGGNRSGAQKDLNNMYEVFHDLNFEIKWKPFCHSTQKRYSDSNLTSLCSFSEMLRA
jgi:hypothetical protein